MGAPMIQAYCDRWVFNMRKRIGEITPSEARRRHQTRQTYCALIYQEQTNGSFPECVITVDEDAICVAFLDRLGRKSLDYEFNRVTAMKLFLEQAVYFDYEGDSDQLVTTKAFIFNEDGSTTLFLSDRRLNELRETEIEADVERNWDKFPAFGKYESLMRKER
jgi:hypothetical protein